MFVQQNGAHGIANDGAGLNAVLGPSSISIRILRVSQTAQRLLTQATTGPHFSFSRRV
jgi:hypothetical protein